MSSCQHLYESRDVAPTAVGCQECLATGDTWVHLRSCLTCGNVGCCDQSKNRHASSHSRATGHPVARSMQPGEAWRWCYVDDAIDDPDEVDMEGADLS